MENNQVMNKNQWNQEVILWNSQWNLSTLGYHGSWWTNPMSILSAAPRSKALTSWLWRKKVKSLSRFLLSATPWPAACQAPPSRGFSRPEYWSGLPFPPPGDLPDPGIRARSPTLQTLFYCLSHTCCDLLMPKVKIAQRHSPWPARPWWPLSFLSHLQPLQNSLLPLLAHFLLPAQSWDRPNGQPLSLPSYEFLIKELTHSELHSTRPPAIHLLLLLGAHYQGQPICAQTTEPRQAPPLPRLLHQLPSPLLPAGHPQLKRTLLVYLSYTHDMPAKTEEVDLIHFLLGQHYEDSSSCIQRKQQLFLGEDASAAYLQLATAGSLLPAASSPRPPPRPSGASHS